VKADNPIRRLRLAIAKNQVEFAALIGRSYASLRNYEKGTEVPEDVLDRLKTIAAEHGLGDIALDLSDVGADAPEKGPALGRTLRSHPMGSGKSVKILAEKYGAHAEDHAMLDRILNSGVEEAIRAVRSNLFVFDKYVSRGKKPLLESGSTHSPKAVMRKASNRE
jgi:hypothetical protein